MKYLQKMKKTSALFWMLICFPCFPQRGCHLELDLLLFFQVTHMPREEMDLKWHYKLALKADLKLIMLQYFS